MAALCGLSGFGVADAGAATLIDDLNDLSHIASWSANVGVDTNNAAFFGGDASRLKRWTTTPESIVYSVTGDLQSFTIRVWFDPTEPGLDFTFAASVDNSVFTPVTPLKNLTTQAGQWLQVDYAAAALPPGTRYLKIEYPKANTSWNPQLGQVALNTARNDLILPSVFASDMVLQRNRKITVWGKSLDHDTVAISFRGKTVVTTARGGKWSAGIGPLDPGGPDSLVIVGAASGSQILRNILVGDVWLCSGQSNMWWPLKQDRDADSVIPVSRNPKIRLFSQVITAAKTPADEVLQGRWAVCEPTVAREFSAVAYYFAKEIASTQDVPVGMVQAAVGGTHIESWISREGLHTDPDFAYVDNPAVTSAWYWPEENFPSGPYNAMIRPLMPMALTGILWYQGENNKGDPFTYRKLLPALIQDWRSGFKQGDIPFLLAQLPAYGLDPNWPEMREAQAMAQTALPHVGMTVNIDLGDSADIHPTAKRPFGYRLSLVAREMVYGQNIEYSGPVFSESQASGDSLMLAFDHVGTGLNTTDGLAPDCFEIAGADSLFHPAQAAIRGTGMVRIWSPAVKHPGLFRYAWLSVPHVNLVNGVNLPTAPFRSALSVAAIAKTALETLAIPLTVKVTQAAGSLRFIITASDPYYNFGASAGPQSQVVASLYDLSGNRLKQDRVALSPTGTAVLRMDTHAIAPGVYPISVITDHNRISGRIWIR